MHQPEAQSIAVISRAIAVLKACEALGPGLSLGAIALQVGLPRSTVQRIVRSLVVGGFLVSDGRARSVALGPDLLAMGAKNAGSVFEKAQPFLKNLAEATGETVDLARFNRDHMIFITQVAGAHRLRAVSAVGDVFPMHCTANGKAALALLNDRQFSVALNGKLDKFTHNTLTRLPLLMKDLAGIRASGVATDLEEHTLGISALGAAFTDKARQIYAVSIPIPAVRFQAKRANCQRLLLAAVDEIAKALN